MSAPRNLLAMALVVATVLAKASAVEPGVYVCEIERAILVDRSAHTQRFSSAPDSFIFRAYASRVTPEQLQSDLRSTDGVNPEGPSFVTAAVEGPIFRDTLNALRSMNGRQYVQGAVVIDIQPDGEMSAYGPYQVASEVKLAVYSGSCLVQD